MKNYPQFYFRQTSFASLNVSYFVCFALSFFTTYLFVSRQWAKWKISKLALLHWSLEESESYGTSSKLLFVYKFESYIIKFILELCKCTKFKAKANL